jgi:chemotaxis protein histidine kinase CheA
MTTTLRSVRHAACVVLVLGLVTSCSSETPADDADRLSQDGDSVTARSGVGPAIDAELVLKDLMLWMRDNHDLAPLLHPENSDWLERFAPRGPSGEQTVALSFALRSALSREMEKAALLREGFDASSPGKAGEARPEESSCVAEREHTAKEMEDLRRALSSARAEADERQRALEEELREKKKAHDEVRALYEAALLAARDAEERSAADPAEEVDADSEGETSPVAAVLEEEGDDEEPEPPVEEADDFEPEPTAETTDDEEPEPPVEEADDFEPEPTAETTDDEEPEPPVEEADDFEPEPPVEETDDFEPEPSVEEEDDEEPEPPVEEEDDEEPEPPVEEADDEEPEPPVEEAGDFEPEPPVEEADDKEPEPMAETTDDFDPDPPVDASDAVEPDDPTPHFSSPDAPSPGTDAGAVESALRRIVGGVHAVATQIVAAVYPALEWLARWMMRSSPGVKLSRALDAAALKLELTASAVDARLGTSLASPGAFRFRTAVEVSLAVAALVALLTLRWIARAWYNWTFRQQVTPKDARANKGRLEGTDAPRRETGVERSDGGGPVASPLGYHSSATLRHRSHPTPQVPTPQVPMHHVPTHHVPTQQAPTQWHATPAGNAPPPRAVFPTGPASPADARLRAASGADAEGSPSAREPRV